MPSPTFSIPPAILVSYTGLLFAIFCTFIIQSFRGAILGFTGQYVGPFPKESIETYMACFILLILTQLYLWLVNVQSIFEKRLYYFVRIVSAISMSYLILPLGPINAIVILVFRNYFVPV